MLNHRSRQVILAFVLVLLTACASGGRKPLSAEQQVTARADARWSLIIAGDWQAAYEMLTPGHRQVMTSDAYRLGLMNRKVDWIKAATEQVSCESEDKCTATVKIDYAVEGGLPGAPEFNTSGRVEETWLRLEDVWYHLPRR